MRMFWKQSTVVTMTTLAMITMMVVGGSSTFAATDDMDRANLKQVLRDAQIELAAISDHAAKLDRMVEWPNLYTMSAHEFEWTGIKARFNEVGKLVPKMQSAPDASAWQKEVVEEIASLIKAMEVQVDAGFQTLEAVDNAERLYTKDLYQLRIESIQHYADHINDLIEYVETRRNPTS